MLQSKAFFYQDVIANRTNPNKSFDSPFWQVKEDKYKQQKLQAAWWWFCKIEPIFKKFISITCAISTILVIWSESTFQVSAIPLAIPSLILSPNTTTFVMELLAIGFICYMCTCTYYTLLRIKILDIYQVVPDRNTNEVSMLFVGAYLWYINTD